jgi:hypothetical protein
MRTWFIAVALVIGVQSAQAEDKMVKGPGLSVKCSDFKKQPDGSWLSGPQATLSYPDNPGQFANGSIRAGAMFMDNVDVGAFLDRNCSSQ